MGDRARTQNSRLREFKKNPFVAVGQKGILLHRFSPYMVCTKKKERHRDVVPFLFLVETIGLEPMTSRM